MPDAIAILKGNFLAPSLNGMVEFYPWKNGTLVKIEINNLPKTKPPIKDIPPIGPFAFHIHEGESCNNKMFEDAKGHYNPTNQPHPFHVGDLPSILSNNGYAYMIVYTQRFKPKDVINKTVIIHLNPDDYRSQPSGNAGERVACGIIKRL